MKNKRKILIISTLLLFGLIGFTLLHQKNAPKPIPTIAVTQGNITEKIEAVGYLKPVHLISVKSQIDGVVEARYHEEGDFVKKNDPLIKIKPQPSPSSYAETYQLLDEAKAKEKSAKLNYERFQHALQKKLITPQYTDYINAKRDYETAQLARKLAEQKLALIDIGKTRVAEKSIENIVTSSIDGYVLTANVDVGDAVISMSSAQASTTLFALADMNDLMFEGIVDEADASKIHLDMKALVTIGSMPKAPLTGKLSSISWQSDKENSDRGIGKVDSNSPFNIGFKIRITDLNFPKDLVLRSGYSATALIKLNEKKEILILPERVVRFKEDKPYVLLPSKKSSGKPKEQFIDIGISDGMNIEITRGLKKGDQVLDTSNNGDKAKEARD